MFATNNCGNLEEQFGWYHKSKNNNNNYTGIRFKQLSRLEAEYLHNPLRSL